jgi:hypothetical protein
MAESSDSLPKLAADGMLGGLAKLLRAIGFDVLFPASGTVTDRLFVTVKKTESIGRVIRVPEAEPIEQLRQFLPSVRLKPRRELFLTRCLVCNSPVEPVEKEDISKLVPPAVLEACREFRLCRTCGKAYWRGSHAERMEKRLEAIHVWQDDVR